MAAHEQEINSLVPELETLVDAGQAVVIAVVDERTLSALKDKLSGTALGLFPSMAVCGSDTDCD